MAINRGKDFEKIIRDSFLKVPDTSATRLHDQTNGFMGSANPCDFIVYHKPYLYAIECKSVHGNTLPLSNISKFQWQSLLDMSKVKGVISGVICWWIDKDVTAFIPIQELEECKRAGYKSVRSDHESFTIDGFINISGKKKRVFFEYNMNDFFNTTRIAYERNTI